MLRVVKAQLRPLKPDSHTPRSLVQQKAKAEVQISPLLSLSERGMCWESWGLGVVTGTGDVWWHELTTRERGQWHRGNCEWKWCEARLSALPGRWCLPHGIYRCQHPRETILNNLSSSLQSGEMSPGHLEIADWQLPFLGLSRAPITYLQLSQLSQQGLSLLKHIFIIFN